MRSIRSVLHSLKPQKRVLIIGSAFVDMVINVQEMPRAGADVEGDYRCTTVGGCSFNVADVLYKLDLPFESYMPVGEGRFADLVAQALTERGYPVHREAGEGDNGWCLSLADASGERTFISMFGLERRMKPDWFERFDIESFDYFYVSGYQAEGENGRVILEALSRKRPDAVVVFDPGPRVHFMPRERIEDFCESDDDFHELLMSTLPNKYLRSAYDRITGLNTRFRIMTGKVSMINQEQTCEEHLQILDAALSDNWDGAAMALQHHLELARDKAEGVIKVIRLW